MLRTPNLLLHLVQPEGYQQSGSACPQWQLVELQAGIGGVRGIQNRLAGSPFSKAQTHTLAYTHTPTHSFLYLRIDFSKCCSEFSLVQQQNCDCGSLSYMVCLFFGFFCRLLKSFSQALASHLDVFQQILNGRSGAQCDLRPNKLKSFQCIKISEKCFSGEKNNV